MDVLSDVFQGTRAEELDSLHGIDDVDFFGALPVKRYPKALAKPRLPPPPDLRSPAAVRAWLSEAWKSIAQNKNAWDAGHKQAYKRLFSLRSAPSVQRQIADAIAAGPAANLVGAKQFYAVCETLQNEVSRRFGQRAIFARAGGVAAKSLEIASQHINDPKVAEAAKAASEAVYAIPGVVDDVKEVPEHLEKTASDGAKAVVSDAASDAAPTDIISEVKDTVRPYTKYVVGVALLLGVGAIAKKVLWKR